MYINFDEKVAIVTGGASGMGAALAQLIVNRVGEWLCRLSMKRMARA